MKGIAESSVLVVDDNETNVDILVDTLGDFYDVCRRLKANKKTRNIPVVFVTAMVEVADEIKGFALGAVNYITKPISPPLGQSPG